MLNIKFIEPLPRGFDRFGANQDVGRRAARAAGRLVHKEFGVRQGVAHALLTAHGNHRAHRRGHAADQGRNLGPDILHRVVDAHPRHDGTAGGVDVHGDFLGRVLRLKVEQLRDDQARHAVMYRAVHEDDPLLQKARENVVGALAPAGLFDHHGDEVIFKIVYRIVHLACLIRISVPSESMSRSGALQGHHPSNSRRLPNPLLIKPAVTEWLAARHRPIPQVVGSGGASRRCCKF
mmetsp:Transcript_1279/g.2542  ORF Transcript_1279/g.2542 Transcript_1279/m.2542 type:complete len:235 (+) Transcript_1279:1906-2610(+)